MRKGLSLYELEAPYAQADLYLYAEPGSAGPLGVRLSERFGGTRVRVFTDLGACVLEVMDFAPQLLVIDAKALTSELAVQILRLRTDRQTRAVTVIVRLQSLTESDLAQLLHSGVADISLAKAPLRAFIQRIVHVMDGLRAGRAAGADDSLTLKSLEARLSPAPGLLPSAARLESFRARYGVDVAAVSQSPTPLSGGFWSLSPLDATRFVMCRADFSGHGLKAAPHAAKLHGLLRSQGYARDRPAAALAWLNDRLRAMLPAGDYATMFYGVVDLAAECLTYGCAGVSPQICRPRGDSPYAALDGSGFPLGMIEAAAFDEHTVAFGAGAGLMLYSDAMIETPPPPGAVFTPEELVRAINALPEALGSFDITQALVGALNLPHNTLADDLTLIVLKRL